MSVESDLITALSATGLPVALDLYTGTATTYIVFDYHSTAIWHQDDAPEYEQVWISVSLHAPATTNLTARIAQIKALLFAGGYAYPDVLNLTTKEYGRHVVFETQIREAVV